MNARPRPFVTLKLATSLDGRIAAANGESRWITGEKARAVVHQMRATHDCVAIGIGTALADDPELTVRTEPTPDKQPLRVVFDSHARLPVGGKLAASARRWPVCVFASEAAASASLDALRASGVEVEIADGAGGGVDLPNALAGLKSRGIESVFVEGGGRIAASLIDQHLVDRLEWMRAPVVLGAEGADAIGSLLERSLGSARRWRRTRYEILGEDVWETYEAQA